MAQHIQYNESEKAKAQSVKILRGEFVKTIQFR